MDALVLVLHVVATFTMTGLIWMVHWVHYPLFAEVGPATFEPYHQGHTSRITGLVLPLMSLEAATAGILCIRAPFGVPSSLWWLGAGLVGAIWAITLGAAVARHTELGQGFDAQVLTGLLRWNGLRTGLWTVRTAGLALLLFRLVSRN